MAEPTMAESATSERAMPEKAIPEKPKERVPPRRKSRVWKILIFVAVIAVLALGGFFLWRYLNTYEATDDAQIDGHINAISARISGNVIDVQAEDEQIVKAGDV